jgi:predicted secreted protein
MAGTIGGYGILVKIDITATPTIISYLIDAEVPEFEKIMAEATPQNATSGYAVWVATGKRKLGEFKITLGWDKDEATHAAIRTAFGSDSPVNFNIVTPGTDENIAFSGHVMKLGRIAEQEDYYKCEVTVQPTGAPTIT